MDEARKILINVLHIIGYNKDKVRFANEFIDLCCRKAVIECISALNKEHKNVFDDEIKGIRELDKCIMILQKFITREAYEKTLEKISSDMFVSYINSIIKALNKPKREKLRKYLEGIK